MVYMGGTGKDKGRARLEIRAQGQSCIFRTLFYHIFHYATVDY